ncbi:hypothetical protein Maq22A_3p50305 (plasmid) [Methylobacterium aquaticum]|uniref:Uncharacterized protein n=1 Tax=Methylobacterium aquaticum TaxID=270351 RepID=A0A0C6FTB2_9HYPH|nr:hypothetical protein Maq22A_3p50305 [Methylobacterium aquaticum]
MSARLAGCAEAGEGRAVSPARRARVRIERILETYLRAALHLKRLRAWCERKISDWCGKYRVLVPEIQKF